MWPEKVIFDEDGMSLDMCCIIVIEGNVSLLNLFVFEIS